jgi:hypothetical protein
MKQKTMLSILFLGGRFGATVLCASQPVDVSVATYYVPVEYDSTAKTDTTAIGAYSYWGYKQHSLELEFDQVSSTVGNVSIQQNTIGLYTYYGLPYTRLKAGCQHIETPTNTGSTKTYGGNVIILGAARDQVNYYGYKIWTSGIDAFVSDYDGFTPIQIAPYFTTYFKAGPQMSLTGKLNTQYLSQNSPTVLNTLEASLQCYWSAFTLTAQATAGQSKFGVFNGGFLAYNTADVVQDGLSLSGTYYATSKLSFTASKEMHRLIVSGESDPTLFSKLSVMANYHF